MKTITELNNKIWYRSLKVFYFSVSLILILITTNILVFNNTKVVDYEKSELKCKNETSVALSQFPLTSSLNYYDLLAMNFGGNSVDFTSNRVEGDLDKQFRAQCSMLVIELKDKTMKLLPYSAFISLKADDIYKINGVLTNNQDVIEIQKDLEQNPNLGMSSEKSNYSLSLVSKNLIVKNILILISILLSYILGTELARRLFYYIILGNIKPKKS